MRRVLCIRGCVPASGGRYVPRTEAIVTPAPVMGQRACAHHGQRPRPLRSHPPALQRPPRDRRSAPRRLYLPYISPRSRLYLRVYRRCSAASYISPISPLYLPCISPISRIYLPYLSLTSPLSLAGALRPPISPPYLPYISLISPLYLAYISPISRRCSAASRCR